MTMKAFTSVYPIQKNTSLIPVFCMTKEAQRHWVNDNPTHYEFRHL